MGRRILEARKLRHLHNSLSDNLGPLRLEPVVGNAAQARKQAK